MRTRRLDGVIGNTIAKEENWVRVGMGGALMSIGKRNKKLNAAAIKAAKQSARSTSATGTRSASR
jgi:3-methyladenine DNA glycosylase AlkD